MLVKQSLNFIISQNDEFFRYKKSCVLLLRAANCDHFIF